MELPNPFLVWIEKLSQAPSTYLIAALGLLLLLVTASHAILYKRDPRSAIAWVGLIIFSPIVGSVLYYLFGINRVRRKAQALVGEMKAASTDFDKKTLNGALKIPPHLVAHERCVRNLTNTPLSLGNSIDFLPTVDLAVSTMLMAIEGASEQVLLCSYIFARDETGKRFAKALEDAKNRGVEVKVLIDAVGAKYSLPTIVGELKRRKIPYARFLPIFWPWKLPYGQLRNHRKILVIDGKISFTGSMNLQSGRKINKEKFRDIHFCFQGSVVGDFVKTFSKDWSFSGGKPLENLATPIVKKAFGSLLARGIPDGPDENLGAMETTVLSAIAASQKTITIQTPYFLPNAKIISLLSIAGLQGVDVKILLPERGNLRFVQWASEAQYWQILEGGCRIFLYPGSFDHSKLFLIDNCWSLVGSTNWDARSFRLNFEYNVEVYDEGFAGLLMGYLDEKISRSREVTQTDLEGKPFLKKLRNGTARLFSAYL